MKLAYLAVIFRKTKWLKSLTWRKSTNCFWSHR